MKRICPACGMVQTQSTCIRCKTATVTKGRHVVHKDSRGSSHPKEGRSNG